MYRNGAAVVALFLLVAGCGSATPLAKPPAPPKTTAPRTTSTTTTTTTTTSVRRPATPPTTDVHACYEANCTLLLTAPTTIPLDAAKFHYPSMQVTAISADSLSYTVTYPGGGGAASTIGPGLNGSSFSFQNLPAVEVGLTLVNGEPALVLQSGSS
jgi:predicted small lipoprotein YifL